MDCIPRAVCSNFCRVRQTRFFIFPTPASMLWHRSTRHRLENLRTFGACRRENRGRMEVDQRSGKALLYYRNESLDRDCNSQRLNVKPLCLPLLLLSERIGK